MRLKHASTPNLFLDGGENMSKFVCPYCNTEIEVEYLDDVVECPNCGEVVSRENAGKVIE